MAWLNLVEGSPLRPSPQHGEQLITEIGDDVEKLARLDGNACAGG